MTVVDLRVGPHQVQPELPTMKDGIMSNARIIRASIRYGESYAWTDVSNPDEEGTSFRSVAEVMRELASPGSVTGHPPSYFPCSRDWHAGDVIAFIYATGNNGETLADPDWYVKVGPRGGLTKEAANG